MKRLFALSLVAVLPVLSACGPSEPEIPCEPVGADLAERIAEGANGIAITPTGRIGAVKSPNFDNLYIVAMEFTYSGVNETDIGAWATPELEGSALTLSVDALAATFTDWPNQIHEYTFDVTEPGVSDAKLCLENS